LISQEEYCKKVEENEYIAWYSFNNYRDKGKEIEDFISLNEKLAYELFANGYQYGNYDGTNLCKTMLNENNK
jgi:hypothetical protein